MSLPRVVLVDDNPEILDYVPKLLLEHFNVVGAFQDGRMFLDALGDLKPDVVVLDISMDTINGFEIARELKRLGCTARVVFLTFQRDEEFVQAAFAAGACAYVLKLNMGTDLVPAIRASLSGKRFWSPALPYNSPE